MSPDRCEGCLSKAELIAELEAKLAATERWGCEVCGHVRGQQQTGPRNPWRIKYERVERLAEAAREYVALWKRVHEGPEATEEEHAYMGYVQGALFAAVGEQKSPWSDHRPFPCTYRVGGCDHEACLRARINAAFERVQCRDCVWGLACSKHRKGDLK